jgi:hypothetical protein
MWQTNKQTQKPSPLSKLSLQQQQQQKSVEHFILLYFADMSIPDWIPEAT